MLLARHDILKQWGRSGAAFQSSRDVGQFNRPVNGMLDSDKLTSVFQNLKV